MRVIATLRAWAAALRRQARVMYFAARDRCLPWSVRALALLVVAYALSPIDLIPDFIPVLGQLDDLLLVPLGLALVIRLMPPEVLQAAKVRADAAMHIPASRTMVAVAVASWVLLLALLAIWLVRRAGA